MLHVNDLSFRHGERVLFDRASAAMSDGWKVGLVGRNGAGKSTLLRLIQGQIEADGGSIRLSGRNRIGSVPQDPPGGDITVLDAVLAADVERTKPYPDLVHAAIEKGGCDGPVAMVGDSTWDVKAAEAAGVPTLAVLTGGFSEAELREAGAAEVCKSIGELRKDRQALSRLAAPLPASSG